MNCTMLASEKAAQLPNIGLRQSHVLVVDDDSDCVAEYGEMIAGLGYEVHLAGDASTALKLIAEDLRIGIVVTDLKMPGMDGLTLLEELSSRFMPVRPLVAIVATGVASLETAVQAMRSNAMDFLPKPVSHETLAAALRRASVRWTQLTGQFRILALSQLGSQIEITTEVQASSDHGSPAVQLAPSKSDLQAFVRNVVKNRQSRAKYFDPELFAGPAWDILLDLAAAGLHGDTVATSSACAGTQVPLSTALRYINQLVEAGLVTRKADPTDKRRTLLELEPAALSAMTRYLTASWTSHHRKAQ
jgi:CheY-like chemotaxis protein